MTNIRLAILEGQHVDAVRAGRAGDRDMCIHSEKPTSYAYLDARDRRNKAIVLTNRLDVQISQLTCAHVWENVEGIARCQVCGTDEAKA